MTWRQRLKKNETDSNNQNKFNSGGKIIDMTDRIHTPDFRERLRNLKVRLDLEHAKVAVSTSLLSVVVLVTLANNNLMTSIAPVSSVLNEQSSSSHNANGGRGIASIASVPGGGYSNATITENPELVRQLAQRDLSETASVGQKPSSLERLAFGFLEGKYAVRLQDGLIREIEFAPETKTLEAKNEAKKIENLNAFIDGQRDLLPAYSHSVKLGLGHEGSETVETFQLVNAVSMPVAKVQFRVDIEGRFLGMRVSMTQIASK